MNKRKLTPATQRAYERWTGRFVDYLGCLEPQKAQERHVWGYLEFERRRGLSASSRRLAVTAIRFFLKRVAGVEVPSPEGFGLPKPKVKARRILTEDEVAALFARLRSGHGLMARLIYRCGLRAEECCRLRLGDVQAERGLLRVRGKGVRGRSVEVPRDLMRWVRIQKEHVQRLWWRDWQEGWGQEVDLPPPNDAWLFPAKYRSREGGGQTYCEQRKPKHPATLHRALREAVEAAGLRISRPCAALREAFLVSARRQGTSPRELSQILGLKPRP